MLRTSHGAPRPAKGKAAPERPVRPAPRATRASAAEAKPAEARPRASAPTSRRASVATAEDEGSRLKDDGSRLKKAAPRVPGATSTASDDSREVAILIAVAGIEKKASGLEVIDVAGRVDYADFLVLMSGRSDRHVTALASAIEEALRKRNKRALAVEGLPHANWVLMDFGDVVVHVFQDDARSAYDIDALWMDARRVPVPLSEPLPPT
jgi:ribosome-associated protein